MSCFKTRVDVYAARHPPSADNEPFPVHSTTRAPISIHPRLNLGASSRHRSPEVSDTPLDLPQGSLPTQETVYEFEPSPLPSLRSAGTESTASPSIQRLKKNDNGLASPSVIDDLYLPPVRGYTPPPRPDGLVSAAVAFGASNTTAKLIASDKALYELFDGIFPRVAMMNATMKDISEDITTFEKHLKTVKDGLEILESTPRESIQSAHSSGTKQGSSVWDERTVRHWFRDLLNTTPRTSGAWRDMILSERRIFEMSLLELRGTLDARLCKCERALEKLHEDIENSRDPLTKAGDKDGARFGQPWLGWAWAGVRSMKGCVDRFERFSAGKNYERVW